MNSRKWPNPDHELKMYHSVSMGFGHVSNDVPMDEAVMFP